MAKIFALPKEGRTLYRGDTHILDMSVSQAGEAVNLTGYTITFTAKKDIKDADAAPTTIQKTLGSGIVVLDAPTGKIRITLNSADTATFPDVVTTYVADVQIKKDGITTTVASGTITITPDVTRTN
jgi:hypothetical protein